eukprot:2143831-Pleurochrysis_carterae.AAC.1
MGRGWPYGSGCCSASKSRRHAALGCNILVTMRGAPWRGAKSRCAAAARNDASTMAIAGVCTAGSSKR